MQQIGYAIASDFSRAVRRDTVHTYSKQDLFKGLSFTTISSTGPNAAIIHYSPDPESCAVIDPNQSKSAYPRL